MNRREFLLGGLAGAASLTLPGLAAAKADLRPAQLSFYHTHTAESFDLVFNPADGLARNDARDLNHFLRDFRTKEVETIDPALLPLLYGLIQKNPRGDGVFEIISAYRSPKTNKMLRGKSGGVAKKSLHMQGRALDIRLRGTPTSRLRDQAIALGMGGVGYYRRSDFIHVDTGRVRRW